MEIKEFYELLKKCAIFHLGVELKAVCVHNTKEDPYFKDYTDREYVIFTGTDEEIERARQGIEAARLKRELENESLKP